MEPEIISPMIVYFFNFPSPESARYREIKSLEIVVALRKRKLFAVDIMVANNAA
jgi:hypothetical protein